MVHGEGLEIRDHNRWYVGPFKVLERIGDVAYKLDLPEELSRVHNTFHVSNLKKCLADEPLVVPLDGLHFDDKLHFVEEPVDIVDRECVENGKDNNNHDIIAKKSLRFQDNQLGNFSVIAFNEVVEMCVENGKDNNNHDIIAKKSLRFQDNQLGTHIQNRHPKTIKAYYTFAYIPDVGVIHEIKALDINTYMIFPLDATASALRGENKIWIAMVLHN
nr:putative reverse transcriptase domain-containing protein [Tanacetum cinerariifolium]